MWRQLHPPEKIPLLGMRKLSKIVLLNRGWRRVMPQTTNTSDIIKDSVASAVGNVVSAMEPQLNRMATEVANKAIDRSRDAAQSAYQAVQRRPIYLVGLAAILLVGAAILFTVQNREGGFATA